MKGMFVDLKEEIDYVRSYIELQRLRYDNSFGVSFDIKPAALKCGVPKLILQPLVENAINHGLNNELLNGHIEIKGFLADEKLILTVTDNGKGMDEDKIKELVERLNKDQNGTDSYNIGLSNVHQRISILFGEGYGLKITSEYGRGTEILISIPALCKEEMEQYVQGSNS